MAKRRPFRKKKPVQLQHWLKFKPYRIHSAYDKYYVEVANRIFEVLEKQKEWLLEYEFQQAEIRELALILTCLFEDIANEMGIWRTFIDYNQELYGYYLPFYDIEGYDPEDVNPQDCAYIIWHFMTLNDGRLFAPDSPFILEMGNTLFLLMDEEMEDAWVTEFYEQYLHIPDDIHFFELKMRMKWFALDSYIPGCMEFQPQLELDLVSAKEESPELWEMGKGMVQYGIEEPYSFQATSSFSGLSVREWWARMSDSSTSMKAHIRKLNRRVEGLFAFDGYNEHYWKFKHIQSGIPVEVVRESVDINIKQTQMGDIHFIQLINWKGDWWLSGMLAYWGQPKEEDGGDLRQELGSTPFFLYSENLQQTMREDTGEMMEMFLTFFGKQVVLFKDQKELQQAMEDYMQYYNRELVKRKGLEPELAEDKKITSSWEGVEILDDQQGIGAAFISGVGTWFSPHVPRAVKLMKKKSPTQKEKAELFHLLLNGTLHPEVSALLIREYSSRNLTFPISTSKIPGEKYIDFFMRFMNPEAYKEKIPSLRFQPDQLG